MPFKEKIAWISVVTTILVWGTYFAFLIRAASLGQAPGHAYLVGFFGAVVVQTILVIAASIVTAITTPGDAGAGRDERDKAVARRSTTYAYPVLLAAIVVVAASIHVGATRIGMTYGIMGAIVIAEIVHYGAQIIGYRRGWHG